MQAVGIVSERLHDREQHDSVKLYILNMICMVVIVAAVVGVVRTVRTRQRFRKIGRNKWEMAG